MTARRNIINVDALGERYVAGESLRALAAEIGWQTASLHVVFSRCGYLLGPELLRQRRAETAVRVAAGRIGLVHPWKRERVPTEPKLSPEVICRHCQNCSRKFETQSRFIRRCVPCKSRE